MSPDPNRWDRGTRSPADLRHLFPLPAAYAPDDSPSSGGASTPSAGSPGDAVVADGAAEGEEEDCTEDEDAEVITDAKVKKLHEEAKTWRRKFREAEAKVKTLEETTTTDRLAGENRTLRLRLAFERAGGGLRDVEAAWRLADDDLAGVEVKDGTVDTERVAAIVQHVLDRYPYLAAEDEPEDLPKDAFPLEASGRPTSGRKKNQQGPDLAALAKKFPALRNW